MHDDPRADLSKTWMHTFSASASLLDLFFCRAARSE
jgi:hypothetical protein